MNPEQHRPVVESVLRVLDTHAETFGFDTKPLWHALTMSQRKWEEGVPTEEDMRYVLPTVPPDVATHFVDGTPQELGAAVLWVGYSYTLTPGQRSLLRDTYGMTPTQTVTVERVEAFTGTQFARVMKLRSDMHVDPKNRRHVLISATINNVAEFFRVARELDDVKEQVFGGVWGITESNLTLGKLFDLQSEERWAVEDITGVKMGKRVEMERVTPEHFNIIDVKTGSRARVPRDTFFPLVEEYAKLHRVSKPRSAQREVQSLTSMLESMGLK